MVYPANAFDSHLGGDSVPLGSSSTKSQKKKTFPVGGPQSPFSPSSSFILSFVLPPFFLKSKKINLERPIDNSHTRSRQNLTGTKFQTFSYYYCTNIPNDPSRPCSLFHAAPSVSFAKLAATSVTPTELILSLTPPTIDKRNGLITLYQYRSRRGAPQADVFSQWQNIAVQGSETEQNAVQTISLSSLQEYATYEVSVKACTGPALCSTEKSGIFMTRSARKFKLF